MEHMGSNTKHVKVQGFRVKPSAGVSSAKTQKTASTQNLFFSLKTTRHLNEIPRLEEIALDRLGTGELHRVQVSWLLRFMGSREKGVWDPEGAISEKSKGLGSCSLDPL